MEPIDSGKEQVNRTIRFRSVSFFTNSHFRETLTFLKQQFHEKNVLRFKIWKSV